MVSKNQKIAVFAIAIIIVLASGAFILAKNQEPTPAEQMILLPSDIGPGWQGGSTHVYPFDSNASSYYEVSYSNGTVDLDITIEVFNFSNGSHMTFQKEIRDSPPFFENINMGDEGAYYPQELFPIVIFTKDNVYAWVQIYAHYTYEWLKNATIAMAELQLQKIDQYLAQHPGANE